MRRQVPESGWDAGRGCFLIKKWLCRQGAALMLALMLTGCGGGAADRTAFLEPGTQGANTVEASRGVASGDTLFVSLEQEIAVVCTVDWEILGDEVTQQEVVLMLETFRMYLKDALDGLTTDEAQNGDMDSFAEETAQKAAEKLTNDALFVSVGEVSAERIREP